MEWEKIFASNITDKGLVSTVCKELLRLNTQKTNNPVKKWVKDMNRHLAKEDILMAKWHMKLHITIIREIQIKTTMRYHLTPIRIAKINNSGNSRCWWGCGERGSLLHCWWECKLMQPLWKNSLEVPQKIKNITTLQPSNCTTRYLSKGFRFAVLKGAHAPQCIAVLSTIAKVFP